MVKRADNRLMREKEQHRIANKRAEEAAARASAQIAALEKQLQDATDACKVGRLLLRQTVHLSCKAECCLRAPWSARYQQKIRGAAQLNVCTETGLLCRSRKL